MFPYLFFKIFSKINFKIPYHLKIALLSTVIYFFNSIKIKNKHIINKSDTLWKEEKKRSIHSDIKKLKFIKPVEAKVLFNIFFLAILKKKYTFSLMCIFPPGLIFWVFDFFSSGAQKLFVVIFFIEKNGYYSLRDSLELLQHFEKYFGVNLSLYLEVDRLVVKCDSTLSWWGFMEFGVLLKFCHCSLGRKWKESMCSYYWNFVFEI